MAAYNANNQPTLAWCLTKINPLKPGLRKAKDFEKKADVYTSRHTCGIQRLVSGLGLSAADSCGGEAMMPALRL
jgi:hypothetical protein